MSRLAKCWTCVAAIIFFGLTSLAVTNPTVPMVACAGWGIALLVQMGRRRR